MKITKIIALVLCLAVAVGIVVIPSAADTVPADRHKLTGIDLIRAYGLEPYGSDADVEAAEIVDGQLVIKWGSSESYPKLEFVNSPKDLKKYTIQIDFITVEDTTNKLNWLLIAKTKAYVRFGFRTGEYSEGKSWGNIMCSDGGSNHYLGLGTGANTPSFGTNNHGVDLTSISNANPVKHTFSATIDATSPSVAEVTLVVDGIKIAEGGIDTETTGFTSAIGLAGWKTNSIAVDNLIVTDNITGNVAYSENFDDHTFGNNMVNVDENYHGYTCACGASDVTEHVWNAGVSIPDENSCQGQPSMKYTCLICSAEKTVVGKPHTPGEPKVVAATCTEDGYTETVCTVCNAVLEHTVIEKTGHSYGLWVVVKEATETEDGEKQQVCELCNDVKSKVIEKTGGEGTTAGENTTTEAAGTTGGSASTTAPADDNGGCGGFTAVAAAIALVMSFGMAVVMFVSKK